MNKTKVKASERQTRSKQKNKKSPSKEKKIQIPTLKRNLSLEEIDDEYCEHVIKMNKKYSQLMKKHPNKNYEYDKNVDLKRCEVCTDFVNDQYMLLCDICDDGYHTYCLVLIK